MDSRYFYITSVPSNLARIGPMRIFRAIWTHRVSQPHVNPPDTLFGFRRDMLSVYHHSPPTFSLLSSPPAPGHHRRPVTTTAAAPLHWWWRWCSWGIHGPPLRTTGGRGLCIQYMQYTYVHLSRHRAGCSGRAWGHRYIVQRWASRAGWRLIGTHWPTWPGGTLLCFPCRGCQLTVQGICRNVFFFHWLVMVALPAERRSSGGKNGRHRLLVSFFSCNANRVNVKIRIQEAARCPGAPPIPPSINGGHFTR